MTAGPDHDVSATQVRLRGMITGYRVSNIIGVTARVGNADHLAKGPRSSDDLAAVVGADPSTLRRFLRALAGLELVEQADDGRFALTSMGRLLRADVPGSLLPMALVSGAEYFQRPWCALDYSVRTGQAAFNHVHRMSNWEYRRKHPEAERQFNRLMTAMSEHSIPAILGAYDFSPFRRVVDVGGGRGHLLAAILDANPAARGVLFDQPSVVEDARAYLQERGVLDRCELVGGSFFETVPADGDLYVLKAIIHDWPDEPSRRILTACRQVMGAPARLLLVERVVKTGPDVDPEVLLDDALNDLLMLVMQAGQERTAEEFRDILEPSGFALRGVIPTGAPPSIVEAEPV